MQIQVEDLSSVGEARRGAVELAHRLGLGDADAGRIALVVTEVGTNLVKHAGGGELLLSTLGDDGPAGVAVLALDRGPGIADLSAALRDGFSSAGTPGNGLGAVQRLASEFDMYTRLGAGTAIFATVCAAPATRSAPPGLGVASVGAPYPGETVSGDCWAMHRDGARLSLLVADGLGHGVMANAAGRAAQAAFFAAPTRPPAEIVQRIHDGLRSTRGAAVAVAVIDPSENALRYAGIGNIASTIVNGGTTRSLVSHHGTAGHDVRRIQEFTYAWAADAMLVMHSDGLTARWTLDPYPGLALRHPMVIAGVLYRDCRRGRDDATVVVVRSAA